MGRLDGKVALVTGAARGTGAKIARLFAAEGARVALGDVRDELCAEVAREIGAAALALRLDVTAPDDWKRAIEATLARFGRLDVLVNNAAVLHMASIADTTAEDFLRVVGVNQLGTFLGIQAAIAPLRDAGGGSIVNVASVDALRGQNGIVAYASSKWAVRGITRVAALEPYMPPGVSVEAVIPRMQPHLSYQKNRTIDELMSDVAYAVLYLASDESRSCTGSDLVCEGGNTAGRLVRGGPGAA